MKKVSVVLATVIIAVQLLLPLHISAASAMKAEAKAGDPVVNGVYEEDEYGDPFVLSAFNSVSWGGWDPINTSVVYRFAWSKKGLYIAVTYDPSFVEQGTLFQLDCDPGNQLPGNEQGLFFSVYSNKTVTIHNHKTMAGDASYAPFDITDQVRIASAKQGGLETIEVLLPMQAFRISNRDYTFSPGTMDASAVVMLKKNDTFTVGAAVSSNLEAWTLKEIGLGTLVLSEPEGMDSSRDQSKQMTSFFWIGLIALGVLLILGAIVVTIVVIVVVVIVVKRRKKGKNGEKQS